MARAAKLFFCIFLLSVTPFFARAAEWEREVFLGFSFAGGNSDALSGNLRFEASKAEAVSFDFSSFYGKTGGTKFLDRSSASARWRKDFKRLYYSGLGIKAERDAIAELDYRYIVSPVMGARLIQTETTNLNLETGPAYLRERQAEENDSALALRLFESFERRFALKSRLSQSFELTASGDNDYLAAFEIGAVSAVSGSTNLRVMLEISYDNSPSAGGEKYDAAVTASLGFRF